MSKTVKPGDVFTAKLPDGRYKVVRIIRKEGKMSLVYTSQYLGNERPALDEPLLRKTVVQRRFFLKGQIARYWLEGKPSPNFELLGNIPPTNKEAAIKGYVYAGRWMERVGDEAYLEWRWLHDRQALQEEVRKADEELQLARQRPQKPKKMIGEDEFWSIIAMLDWKHEGNDAEVLAPAIRGLAAKSTTDIRRFEERLSYLLYQLDTKAHASNSGELICDPESGDVSADGFLYARCVVVANGREFYEAVLKDPTSMPKDVEFESLLGLARDAYESKTGRDLDYSPGCSYETFSNEAGWRES